MLQSLLLCLTLQHEPLLICLLGQHSLARILIMGGLRWQPGDLVVVDGGMVSLEIESKMGPDVHCRVVDPGIILSRANLTFRRGGSVIRARNSMLPVLSSKARISMLLQAVIMLLTNNKHGCQSTRGLPKPWPSVLLPKV